MQVQQVVLHVGDERRELLAIEDPVLHRLRRDADRELLIRVRPAESVRECLGDGRHGCRDERSANARQLLLASSDVDGSEDVREPFG